jgi:hypothetical protein
MQFSGPLLAILFAKCEFQPLEFRKFPLDRITEAVTPFRRNLRVLCHLLTPSTGTPVYGKTRIAEKFSDVKLRIYDGWEALEL